MFWIMMIVNTLVIAIIGFLAYLDDFLTPAEAWAAGYQMPVTPFLAHGGMWSDLFLLSFVLATIIGSYSDQWEFKGIPLALVIGFGASIEMHGMYRRMSYKVPNFLAHNGRVPPAGLIHMLYMGCVLSILILFYSSTPHVSPADAIWISTALALHIAIGIIQPAWYVGDSLLYPPLLYPLIGSWILIAVSWWWLISHPT
jgi:hypothetical protein